MASVILAGVIRTRNGDPTLINDSVDFIVARMLAGNGAWNGSVQKKYPSRCGQVAEIQQVFLERLRIGAQEKCTSTRFRAVAAHRDRAGYLVQVADSVMEKNFASGSPMLARLLLDKGKARQISRRTEMNREISQKTNILVIDDEEVVRHSHLRVLSGTNCTVETAWNGSEGLRALEGHPFDVVLLDLRMPGMDGLDVLREIKNRWPECEVVVITGYPSLETAKEALRLGAYDYLSKPVEPDKVIDATCSAVRQKRWTLHREAMAC